MNLAVSIPGLLMLGVFWYVSQSIYYLYKATTRAKIEKAKAESESVAIEKKDPEPEGYDISGKDWDDPPWDAPPWQNELWKSISREHHILTADEIRALKVRRIPPYPPIYDEF